HTTHVRAHMPRSSSVHTPHYAILSLSSTLHPPPSPTLFPYTTLFRSLRGNEARRAEPRLVAGAAAVAHLPAARLRSRHAGRLGEDRKSTRLNSSHQIISYAVFCLKKKSMQRAGICIRRRRVVPALLST